MNPIEIALHMNAIEIAFHPDTPDEYRNPSALTASTMSFGHDLRIAAFGSDTAPYPHDSIEVHPGGLVDVTFHLSIDTSTQWLSIGDAGHVGVAGIILPRSGLGTRGLTLANGVGLIDSDYTKPLRGRLALAPWATPMYLNRWDRVAQLVFMSVLCPYFKVVESLGDTGRGGFGSTGAA